MALLRSRRVSAPRLHVTHLVRTSSFAGVERYVSYLAPAQVAQGLTVTVIGGDPDRMSDALRGTGVTQLSSRRAIDDGRSLRTPSRTALVHAHMTDADLVAVLSRPYHRRPIVSTLHFAKPRGRDRLRRAIFSPLPRLLDGQIAISRFVAETSDQPDAVEWRAYTWSPPSS